MTNILQNVFGCYDKDNMLLAFLIIILLSIMISSTINFNNKTEQFDQTVTNIDNYLKTYVINLKTRPEKLIHMKTQLEKHKMKYNIFNGINGNFLNIDQLNKLKIIDDISAKKYMKRNIRKGEYGCALSHILIWHKLLEESDPNVKYFLILEDDAYLVNNFKEKLTKVLEDIDKKTWDVLYLNENCYKHFGVSCNGDDFSETTIIPNRVGYGLYGYIINKNFVKKCIDSLFPINYAIDVFLDEASLQKKFICLRSKEIIVHYNKKFASDTQRIL